MRVWSRIIVAIAITACVAVNALADGAVFAKGTGHARITHESVLITFDGKTERLVIEPTIEGDGTEFAWVIPVPATPKIEQATTGLFPTLRYITRPRAADLQPHWFPIAVVFTVLGLLVTIGVFARWRPPSWLTALLLMILAGYLSMTYIPPRETGFHVSICPSPSIEGETAAALEVTTPFEKDSKAVAHWLSEHGYGVSEETRALLEEYAKAGWVFVAVRMRTEAEGKPFTAAPLSFTFPTSSAICPMRLTGIESGWPAIELFLAGNQEASADSFRRLRQGRLLFDTTGAGEPFSDGRDSPKKDDYIMILHETLSSYCKGFGEMTVLSSELSPKTGAKDVILRWQSPHPFQRVRYSHAGAVMLALQWATLAFFLCAVWYAFLARGLSGFMGETLPYFLSAIGAMLAGAGLAAGMFLFISDVEHSGNGLGVLFVILSAVGFAAALGYMVSQTVELEFETAKPSRLRTAAMTLILPVLIGCTIFFAIPKVPNDQFIFVRGFDWHFVPERLMAWQAEAPKTQSPTQRLTELRKWVQDELARNPLTHGQFREEDSPGNYTIKVIHDRPECSFYDQNGREISSERPGSPRK